MRTPTVEFGTFPTANSCSQFKMCNYVEYKHSSEESLSKSTGYAQIFYIITFLFGFNCVINNQSLLWFGKCAICFGQYKHERRQSGDTLIKTPTPTHAHQFINHLSGHLCSCGCSNRKVVVWYHILRALCLFCRVMCSPKLQCVQLHGKYVNSSSRVSNQH